MEGKPEEIAALALTVYGRQGKDADIEKMADLLSEFNQKGLFPTASSDTHAEHSPK